MDVFCQFRIPGEVRQVVDFVIRKTYGWNKKLDVIANSQFIKATGLKKGNVSRSLKIAIEHKLVIKSDNKVGFNKNYEQWIGFGKLSKVITPVIKSDNKKLSKVRDTIDKKDTIQKKERFSFNSSSFKWKKILRAWRESGHKTVGRKKLVIKRDGTKWLLDENNKWEKYN
jgi:phage replication O-like protein O